MKIFTSYFTNRNLPDSLVKISISRFPPKGWTGLQYLPLAPSPELLAHVKQTHDHDHYTDVFGNQLKSLDKNQVLEDIGKLSGNRDTVLLCYEKPGNFCHRHLVAEWLSGVEEYISPGDTCEESLF